MTHTKRPVLCYLRTHRRLWGLSQHELAAILGFSTTAHVSRIENGKRAPTIESALACQVLFGVPPADMFPRTYELVEEKVVREIYQRHSAIADTTSPARLRKRQLFAAALRRAIGTTKLSEGYDA